MKLPEKGGLQDAHVKSWYVWKRAQWRDKSGRKFGSHKRSKYADASGTYQRPRKIKYLAGL